MPIPPGRTTVKLLKTLVYRGPVFEDEVNEPLMGTSSLLVSLAQKLGFEPIGHLRRRSTAFLTAVFYYLTLFTLCYIVKK